MTVPAAIAVWTRSVKTGQRYDIELRQRRADGVYRWFHVQGLPVRDTEGCIIRWCVLQTDIEDRKRAEAAQRETQRELRQSEQLSASIVHEINQPLASVVTNAHAAQIWLSHDPPNVERAQATLERIVRDGHSAADVVSRIRALFREAAPVKGLVDLNQIVAEVLRVLADELRENNMIVAIDLEAALPMVEADHIQIQQALINLVHNAAEA